MERNELPIVSICVLSMNHEQYVLQCLESIANQDYPNIEVIFVDNNSVDKTFEKGLQFLQESKIAYQAYKREKNYLTAPNCNYQLSKVRGSYACMISADDWMAKKNISKKMECMLSDPEIALVFGRQFTFIDETKEIIEDPSINQRGGYIFDELIESNFIGTGFILRMEKLKSVGFYNENLKLEDWDLLLRLSKKYKFGFVDDYLVYYRRHISNTSAPLNEKYFKSKLQVIDQYNDSKKYKLAKSNVIKLWVYDNVRLSPSLKTLRLVLSYFKFDIFYLKQILKLIALMMKKTLSSSSR